MKELEGELQTNQKKRNEASFWIHLYDLPLYAMNERVGQLIGKAIGEVEKVDAE